MTQKININHLTMEMYGKMEFFGSFNALNDNFCKKMRKIKGSICQNCYSEKFMKFRPMAKNKFAKNSEVISKELLVINDFPRINMIYFRFNAFGELINSIHFLNLCTFAKANPKVTFVLWTKRMKIVDMNIKEKPDNMIIIYSSLKMNIINVKKPKNADKVFTVYTEEFAKEHNININCGGKKCINCLNCYVDDNGIIFINELIRK